MKKYFFIKLLFLILILRIDSWANRLDDIYNGAVALYENNEYKEAVDSFKILEKKEYSNSFLFFMMGKAYRHLEESSNAIHYLKLYIENAGSQRNKIFAEINLAYEYLKRNHQGDLKLAMKVVDKIIDGNLKNNLDVKFCYSTVYNSYGFHYLVNDEHVTGDIKYYSKPAKAFEKALKQRPDLVGIANNLCISYIRLIELYLNEKKIKEAKFYIEKCDRVLKDKKYESFTRSKFQSTKKHFYKAYSKYLKN